MLTGGRRHVVRDIYMPTAGESSEDTYAPTQKQKHDYIESAVETGGYIAYRYVHAEYRAATIQSIENEITNYLIIDQFSTF